jgi:Holliday junction resolvase RusA-like endonuclease
MTLAEAVSASCLLNVFVSGVPAPAGSKTAFAFKRANGTLGAAVTDASKRSKPWKQCLAAVMSEHYDGVPQPTPLGCVMTFTMPRPLSHYGTKKGERYVKPNAPVRHTSKPDLDKLVRAVFDAGSGLIWTDDHVIAEMNAMKIYGEKPGVLISVWRA